MKNKRDENKTFSQPAFFPKNRINQKLTLFPKNRRGQDLSTSTIILLILGVVLLVVLILGFSLGWDKLAPWLSSNNVDTIVNQCQVSCTTSDTYGYCNMNRTLKADDLPKLVDPTTNKEIVRKEVVNTCLFFSENSNYVNYNVGKCPELCTQKQIDDAKIGK